MIRSTSALLAAMLCGLPAAPLVAIDHIVTLGGGYAPEGNQASLEANVQFFQRVLDAKHKSPLTHTIFFADGFDPQPDLQIVLKAEPSQSPAIDLVREIFAPPSPPGTIPGSQKLGYRNHRVTNLRGSNRLNDVRAGLNSVQNQLRSGDRLFLYVTAHGGSAKKDGSPFNTSITCWGNREYKMQELSEWLDALPKDVPVILIMAQCYCGGFAHTVFESGDASQGLSKNLRSGFFAQRHDLPAAGCRPDIDNDEEYSSYFWGALLGETRTGRPALGADYDGDNRVSLAEAHAYAVIESDTIDIPTRGSDALLRQLSRIPHYELDTPLVDTHQPDTASDAAAGKSELVETLEEDAKLVRLNGPVDEWSARAAAIDRSIITGLCRRLEIRTSDDVTSVFSAYEESQREYRAARRGGFGRRGRGGFSRRRQLQEQLIEKWPELESESGRLKLPLLEGSSGEEFVAQVKEMDAYKEYTSIRDQRIESRANSLSVEMRQVLLRRLIHTLETVALSVNLKQLGTDQQQKRFADLLRIEATVLN